MHTESINKGDKMFCSARYCWENILSAVRLSLCFCAAVGRCRGSDAAWPGRPQPELPQQAPWPHPCLPQQRAAAGKRNHSVLLACLACVSTPVPLSHCLLLTPLLPRCPLISACPIGNPFHCPPFFPTPFSPLLLLSDLSCVQSVVVGMPPVSQVSMMEEQQRQNNMVRPVVAFYNTTNMCSGGP